MLSVKSPLLLFLFISAFWVPRLHADPYFASCIDGSGNIFNATVIVTPESVSGFTGTGLTVGSEVAVYSADQASSDLCVGVMTWTGTAGSITIWGNDDLTSVKDGLTVGEGFRFRIFDPDTGTEFDAGMLAVSFLSGSDQYEHDGIYILQNIQTTATVTRVSIPLRAGWNLVGLDRDVADSNYRTLFPASIENTLFSFDGNYVQQQDAKLRAGIGYWLRMASDVVVDLEGVPVRNVTLTLRSGWNLVSGPGCTAPISDFVDPKNIIIDNTLFRFDGSYTSAITMEQGKSYWIRASSAGTVNLACPGVASKQSRIAALPSQLSLPPRFSVGGHTYSSGVSTRSVSGVESSPGSMVPVFAENSFTSMSGFSGSAAVAQIYVRDNANEASLMIGVHPDASDLFEEFFDLFAPPSPPVGAFDARSRVDSEDYLIDIRSSDLTEKIFTILYQAESGEGSIVLSWDSSLLAQLGSFNIVDNVTGALFGPLDMATIDFLDISSAGGLLDTGLRILFTPSVVFSPESSQPSEPEDFALNVATSPSLSWTAAERAQSYHLQVTSTNDASFSQPVFEDSTLTGLSAPVSGLDFNTSYIWRVRGHNEAGFGTWSSIRQFSTTASQSTPTEADITLPEAISLEQNFPNPFNPTTTIVFDLPVTQHVSLKIYDMTGREVATLISRTLTTGRHETRWDATGFSSGVYVYRLQAGAAALTKTLLLLK